MNAHKLLTLIAAAAVAVVALGPAASVAVAEKPQASPPANAQGSRHARGDNPGRGNGREAQDRNRGNDAQRQDRGRAEGPRNDDRRPGSNGNSHGNGGGVDARGNGNHGGEARGPGSNTYARGNGGGGDARNRQSDGRPPGQRPPESRPPDVRQPAYRQADHRQYSDRQPSYRQADYRRYDQRSYARPPKHKHYTYYDARWNHRHYYPPRGYYYPYAPYGAVRIRHHHYNYYYGGGIWYAPRGVGWVVVAPPIGVFVSLLPTYYSTVWFGGIPYYYANDAYYVYRERERVYEVVQPPSGQATTVSPAATDIFVYPRQGQSQEQTDFDRYECHRWAADETGFDPTRADGGVGADQSNAARDEYLRAMTACLEGRGYSVR
ncbi:MAG: hypothetical protein MUC71_04235 [Steroidobacteraceae bacterium]|jgi:hypothetical protein|nr:hypothetical protein [Steroidobacteraceae bacterium]